MLRGAADLPRPYIVYNVNIVSMYMKNYRIHSSRTVGPTKGVDFSNDYGKILTHLQILFISHYRTFEIKYQFKISSYQMIIIQNCWECLHYLKSLICSRISKISQLDIQVRIIETAILEYLQNIHLSPTSPSYFLQNVPQPKASLVLGTDVSRRKPNR